VGDDSATTLADDLRSKIRGDVRFDALSRTLYSTDASIYEIAPAGVVLPRTTEDVVATVRSCAAAGVPVIARGAGTGLTGGAIGEGVAVDLSRYMNRIGPIDAQRSTILVEPGVVLDELNAHLSPRGLHFAPDVATGSRATIGGMIANNSCGAHSIVYGRTVDHVRAITVVLADGEVVTFSRNAAGDDSPPERASRAAEMESRLGEIRDKYSSEITLRFPKVLRSNGGYGLDRLGPPGTPADATRILCGSEGTLGVIVAATLGLVPLPRHRAVAVLQFDDLLTALSSTPGILRHRPAAVELIDRMILEAGRSNPALRQRCDFLRGHPEAVLAIEFFDDSETALVDRLHALSNDPEVNRHIQSLVQLLELEDQAKVWELRKAGLGLLMSRPGDAQPYAFVEDTAVDPGRLDDYIARFREILSAEQVSAGYYAHASVGCIHVKPVLNLKTAEGVATMRRIAEKVADLALEFGGAVTGEHGDGIARSCWIEKVYGPEIVRGFREVKRLFDPAGVLNPHKIVDPWPMNERLRQGPLFSFRSIKTHLDFSAHGGPAGLAGMCSGVGQCRQRLVGTMCPSFVATGDETHTTRSRANALRVALSNRGLLRGLDDPQLAEVMDLCLSCKACKSECPTGVDMARLKAEYLAHSILTRGATPRARFLADLPRRFESMSRYPRIANLLGRSSIIRGQLQRRIALDRRVSLPPFATTTFRKWFRAHRRRNPSAASSDRRVIYFVDTWTNYFAPNVGKAFVRLLEHAGCHVYCPPTTCCGRPAISQGLLTEARTLAEENLDRLAPLMDEGLPLVGTEPSCILTFVDEIPQLIRTDRARRTAAAALTAESFLRRLLDEKPDAFPPAAPRSILYHAHCHQKALVGTADAALLLDRFFGCSARELNTGCCGMAGSFGHETEHYSVARAIGEERLFPAVRDRGNAEIAVSGFSCRTQIEHHTSAPVRHLVEYLADRIS